MEDSTVENWIIKPLLCFLGMLLFCLLLIAGLATYANITAEKPVHKYSNQSYNVDETTIDGQKYLVFYTGHGIAVVPVPNKLPAEKTNQ